MGRTVIICIECGEEAELRGFGRCNRCYKHGKYRQDPERHREAKRLWLERPGNREKARAYRRAWYRRNREKALALGRLWAERNKEKRAAYMREYRRRNRERLNEAKRRWRAANRDKVATYNRCYREKKKAQQLCQE